jgi:uncharacterized protein YggE
MNLTAARTALALCFSVIVTGAPALGQTRVAGPQGKSEPRKVIVSANATTHAKPNAARLTFVVNSQTQGNVREENDRQVAKVKKGIAEMGLKDVEVHLLPASMTTIHVTERPVRGGFAGGAGGPGVAMPVVPAQSRQIQTQFVVTLRDKDRERLARNITKLADLAVENGAMGPADDTPGFRAQRLSIGGPGIGYSETFPGPRIEWLAENTDEARRQAIKQAVKDATDNARAAVGDQANLQVATIEIIVPDEASVPRRYRPAAQPQETGQIAINVEVKVTFTY